MYVYFIKSNGKPRAVKIGKSDNPEKRLKQMQTGCPFPLKLLGKIKCKSSIEAFNLEKMLHERYEKIRINGEWFKQTDTITCEIYDFVSVGSVK